jgi:SAM-dependent methyltransferase
MDSEAEVDLLRRLGLSSEATLVEFGSGTGQFAVAAAPHCSRIVAVDVSQPMLTQRTAKVDARGLCNVTSICAGFLTYRHDGDLIDFAYSRFALHHLPDLWKALALRRLRSQMRDGGVFRLWDVVYDFPVSEAEGRLEAWCGAGGDHVEGEWSRAEIEDHVRDEHSTFSWLLDIVIERSGFEIADVHRSANGFESKSVLRAC